MRAPPRSRCLLPSVRLCKRGPCPRWKWRRGLSHALGTIDCTGKEKPCASPSSFLLAHPRRVTANAAAKSRGVAAGDGGSHNRRDRRCPGAHRCPEPFSAHARLGETGRAVHDTIPCDERRSPHHVDRQQARDFPRRLARTGETESCELSSRSSALWVRRRQRNFSLPKRLATLGQRSRSRRRLTSSPRGWRAPAARPVGVNRL
jgi:hypothetical protein